MNYFYLLAKAVSWGLNLYLWINIIAILLSWVNADPYNKIVHFINRATYPFWKEVQKAVPSALKPMYAYLAILLVIFAEITIPGIVRALGGFLTADYALSYFLQTVIFYLVFGLLTVFTNILHFIFLLSIAWFVITLVNPPLSNPIVRTVMFLLDPFLTPLQRVLPRSSIDLSPIVLGLIAFFMLNTAKYAAGYIQMMLQI